MAAIKINGKTVQRIYKGADEVTAIYKGNVKVWERDFNIDRFHTLCPAATATAVTFDYTSAQDLSALTFCGWVDLAETIGVYNSGTEYFVLSENEIRPKSCSLLFYNYSLLVSVITNNFNLVNCRTIRAMFQKCSNLTNIDVSNWDTSSVTDFSFLFYECTKLVSIDVSNWDTSSVTDMKGVFYHCLKIKSIDVSNWVTNKVTTVEGMFYYLRLISELDISKWDFSKVRNANKFLHTCRSLVSLYGPQFLDTTNISQSSQMFFNCVMLVGGNGTTYDSTIIDKTYFRIDTASTPGYLTLKTA